MVVSGGWDTCQKKIAVIPATISQLTNGLRSIGISTPSGIIMKTSLITNHQYASRKQRKYQ
jgi:hypothetical protein